MSSIPEVIVPLRGDPDGEASFQRQVNSHGEKVTGKCICEKQRRVFLTVTVIVIFSLVVIIVATWFPIQTSNRGKRDAETEMKIPEQILLIQPPPALTESDNKDYFTYHVVEQESSEILEVHSEEDFAGVTMKTRHIKLMSLKNFDVKNLNHSIDKLEIISSKIPHIAIQNLLQEFQEIKTLIIDSEGDDFSTATEVASGNLTLPKLQTLEFINAKHTNSTVPIYLQNLIANDLRNIQFKSCNFYAVVFTDFQKFILSRTNRIKSLEFLDCYFCKTCGMNQLMPRLRYLTVLRNKAVPIPFQVPPSITYGGTSDGIGAT